MLIDVFNGDADGLCALLQWRLEQPAETRLVTGVKRDNALLGRVQAGAGDAVLALDINFENNRADVVRLLAAGAQVRYFDHHAPGELIRHPALTLYIDEAPDTCTSLLMDAHLAGRRRAWAIVGAYGDNLPAVADGLSAGAGYTPEQAGQLRRLGALINYNSYGNTPADLHFAPEVLYRTLHEYVEPVAFVAAAPEFAQLAAGYDADMAAAEASVPTTASARAAAYMLPDAAWSRRVIGVWANALSQAHPERAHLIFCPTGAGQYSASVRAARTRPHGVAAFCGRFPGGGGRASAGGIGGLDAAGIEAVTVAFMASYA